ncbi:hypothetical protein CA13_34380 [Planctomycetes bacterium CA13]|uniref:Chromosome partition protein Smc n=1 Tax=Novipirellula herctigrandis TaxID=2527986 RepID=A0A5C5Z5X9_9BACT|nr:hypothetical protein CA13_34380 [Planctomycetes bacterium CA13]
MPISGPVVHRQLMDAYSNAQQRLEQERTQATSHEERDNLEDHRGEALVELAEHYLPELSRDAILKTWVDVRSQLADVLRRKEIQRQHVQDQLERANQQRKELESALLTMNAQRDEVKEAIEEIANQVEAELRKSAEFVTLSDRAAIAEAALERAEANLKEIEQDAAGKLPSYDESTLFQYLRERGFGTSQYKHRGLTRRMDRWLARYINYNKAKQGYDFLQKTPEQMREIIVQDRAAFDTVMAELEKHRDDAANRFGFSSRVSELQQLEQQRNAQIKLLDQATMQTQGIEAELTDLEGTRGAYYREAIVIFRKMLEQADTRELDRRAAQTPELTDDQIVSRLAGVDVEIGKLEEAAEQRRQSLLHMQSMMDALGQLIQRFRALEFDSAQCQFIGTLDVTDALYRAKGESDVESLWQEIRSSQRWGPTVMDKVTRVATHPMTQVLVNAMAHAAGAALESHARRAGERHHRRRW